MKNKIVTFLTFILYLTLLTSYILGIYHSFKKHSVADGLIGTVIFPWAIYRGVEFWWHDDFSNVDWDKRLNNDLHTCIYFILMVSDNSANKYQLNENLEKFSEKIKNYPTDQKRYLLERTKLYIEYYNSINSDLLNSLKNYEFNGSFIFETSYETDKLENELSKLKFEEEIAVSKKHIEELNKLMQDYVSSDESNINYDKFKDLETKLTLSMNLQQKEYKRIFKSLFNEEL